MDEDGYPTDEELERIEKWPFNDIDGAFAFAKSLWWMPDFGIAEENGVLYLATGGWSGNESIIEAMNKNIGISVRWICSSRGGAHEYEVGRKHVDRDTRFKLEKKVAILEAKRDTARQDAVRLREALELALKELHGIATANVKEWDTPTDAEFKAWAQNRARHTHEQAQRALKGA